MDFEAQGGETKWRIDMWIDQGLLHTGRDHCDAQGGESSCCVGMCIDVGLLYKRHDHIL